ncbi:MAG: hypothetical protein AAF666_19205, partial [Pseudomonadota bacterium]
ADLAADVVDHPGHAEQRLLCADLLGPRDLLRGGAGAAVLRAVVGLPAVPGRGEHVVGSGSGGGATGDRSGAAGSRGLWDWKLASPAAGTANTETVSPAGLSAVSTAASAGPVAQSPVTVASAPDGVCVRVPM